MIHFWLRQRAESHPPRTHRRKTHTDICACVFFFGVFVGRFAAGVIVHVRCVMRLFAAEALRHGTARQPPGESIADGCRAQPRSRIRLWRADDRREEGCLISETIIHSRVGWIPAERRTKARPKLCPGGHIKCENLIHFFVSFLYHFCITNLYHVYMIFVSGPFFTNPRL